MTEKMTVVTKADSSGIEAPPVAPGLLLHKFVKKDSWRGVLTTDATGETLPRIGSAWVYEKEVLVSPGDRRVGATSLEIANGIAERGYFLFPISDDV
jgi:hypothetical protein